MEIRNIQKTGGSSYTITLPKDWIKGLNLSEKSQLEIFFQKKGQLIIRPHIQHPTPKASVIIDHMQSEQMIREIIALYLSGVSEISVHTTESFTYEQRVLVRELSYKLIGFELFDENSNVLTIKNVSNSTIPVSEYANKMMKITESMYQDMQTMLFSNNKKYAKDIVERDVEVDRIQLAIAREFNALLCNLLPEESSNLSLSERNYYQHVAIRLERIADHIVRIAYTILQLKEKDQVALTKPEKDRITKIHKHLIECDYIINNLDKRRAHQLLEVYDLVSKNEFINKKILNTSSLNILIEDSIERIRSYIKNIAEETIDYAAIKQIQPFV
jgi:phosphate uptake regulator